MKYLACLVILFSSYYASATHYRSADMSIRRVSANVLEATLTTYAKWSSPSNLADKDTVTISWGDGSSSIAYRVNGPDVGFPGAPGPNGIPDGELLEGDFKKNVYIATHQYTSAMNGVYKISFFDFNRMDGIANIQAGNSVNVPMYIEVSIDIDNMDATGSMATPVFTVPPIYFANLNDTLVFNPGAYDADGDLMQFSLITPLQADGQNVPSYRTLDVVCPDRAFDIDTDNGDITWITPCQVGIYSLAIQIREYRNGLLLSTTMRDMQFIVLSDPYHPPVINPVVDTILAPGDVLNYSFMASVDDNDSVSLELFPPQFLTAGNSPAIFTSQDGSIATGNFTWAPNASWNNEYPYIFTVAAKRSYMVGPNALLQSSFSTFRVWVADSNTVIAGIKPKQQEVGIRLYPNPAQRYLNIDADQRIDAVSIHSANGKVLFNSPMTNGGQKIDILGYAAGMYYVHVYIGGRAYTRKFVKYAD